LPVSRTLLISPPKHTPSGKNLTMKRTSAGTTRRQFLTTTAAAAAGILAAPTILTAKKTDSALILGEGDYKYEVTHDWPQLPDRYTWQTTHNVAVDKSGCLYVIHQG